MRGGKGARAETLQLLKHRTLSYYQIHAMTYEDTGGYAWLRVCLLEQDEQGFWHDMAGASVNREVIGQTTSTFPWLRTLGGRNPEVVWLGGYVTDNAPDAHRVRLILKDGQILEDTVQQRLVLFLTNQKFEQPVQIEVYNHAGKLIGTQTLFDRMIFSPREGE